MVDHHFYKKPDAVKIGQLIDHFGLTVSDEYSQKLDEIKNVSVLDVAPLHLAQEEHITFLDNTKYLDALKHTKAKACLIDNRYADKLPRNTIPLICSDPYLMFARIAQFFYRDSFDSTNTSGFIHDTAIIDDTAQIGEGCHISAYAVIKGNVIIGKNSVVGEHVTIHEGCQIGEQAKIEASANIQFALIRNRCRIGSGTKIGQPGFGFAVGGNGFESVPQLGRVIIGDDVKIGANVTVDRGSGPDTQIGSNTRIDNLVQIAHNVKIGKSCIIVAQVGISGSTEIEDGVVIAGQAGIAGHLNVGTGARIAARSGVTKNVPAGADYMGYPAMVKRDYLKQVATLSKLAKNKK